MLILNKFPPFTAVLHKYPFISYEKLSYAIQMSNKRPDPTLWGILMYTSSCICIFMYTASVYLCILQQHIPSIAISAVLQALLEIKERADNLREVFQLLRWNWHWTIKTKLYFMDFLQQSICRADLLNLSEGHLLYLYIYILIYSVQTLDSQNHCHFCHYHLKW